jgi:histone H3/H4
VPEFAERERVADAAPDELAAFVDRVIETYTREAPELCDRRERDWVTDLAAKWIFDPLGAGGRTKLD